MNKQQLANKIWASANKMRSKIEANEYKDYILGLIFYKFLSDNEVNDLNSIGWTDEDIVTLVENHEDQEAIMMMEYCRNNIGYFIEYKNLFGTWLKPNSEFSVADLSGALNSFDRLISPHYMGVMTFGGGMAMLPILQREVVDNKHWATEEELVDYFAIGQCTPGIIAVNTATFIGQKYAGIAGGIVATLGVVFPSLVIISILAGLITNFSDLAWVQNAFAGIQVCVCVLIFNAVAKLLKKSVVDKRTAVIFVLVLLGGVFLDLSPVWFVIGAALAGIVLKNWEVRKA